MILLQIIINNIKMPIGHNEDSVIKAAREIVRSDCISAKNFKIYKQSLDARRKNNIHYVYSVTAEVGGKISESANIKLFEHSADIEIPERVLKNRPVVIGMGPCGLFAAYVLALSGNPPIILERGESVDERSKTVKRFWETGILDKNSNVQFGEGGAGTFSDGKLNTRISDPRQRFVLKTFTDFGAPADIMYKAKPHIGTDMLLGTIENMREKLKTLGCDVRFNSQVTDFDIKNGKLCGIEINNDEYLPCRSLILAIGHSSRDTYSTLVKRSVELVPKPFAIGLRIEHSQSFIDKIQYGGVHRLPPADYRVVHNGDKRSCYSFCMCPGGTVVNASSEENMLCVNGMSNYLRDNKNANSAIVATVTPNDFEKGILGGIEIQRKYERLAYELIGDNRAPIQLARDFVNDVPSVQLGNVIPSVTSGYDLAELKKCLPEGVTQTLRDGLSDFEKRIDGFTSSSSVLTGIETRTSAPVRIVRNESMQSINVTGLYPSGEGAGFAGGIVSAAVDGIKSALACLSDN